MIQVNACYRKHAIRFPNPSRKCPIMQIPVIVTISTSSTHVSRTPVYLIKQFTNPKRAPLLQPRKLPHSLMIQFRRRLTRQPGKEALLITLAIQIRQEIIIQSLPIRFGEASLGLVIPVSEVMAHAAVEEVETGREVFRFTAAVVAPDEG